MVRVLPFSNHSCFSCVAGIQLVVVAVDAPSVVLHGLGSDEASPDAESQETAGLLVPPGFDARAAAPDGSLSTPTVAQRGCCALDSLVVLRVASRL